MTQVAENLAKSQMTREQVSTSVLSQINRSCEDLSLDDKLLFVSGAMQGCLDVYAILLVKTIKDPADRLEVINTVLAKMHHTVNFLSKFYELDHVFNVNYRGQV